MTCQQVMDELEQRSDPNIKRIYQNHGAPEPLYGVKVQDLKTLQKKIKKNHALSLQLFQTGNSDAQYLAGLIADETKISVPDLQLWAQQASWYMLSEYTIPWIAADSAHGWNLALQWIDAPQEHVQSSGWSTLSSLVTIKKDSALDLDTLHRLLSRVEKEIHNAGNRVRYAMNGFVIATGCAVISLSDAAFKTAEAIGKVEVNMGGTACKVPLATAYIQKCREKGKLGHKKKQARC